MSEYVHAIAEFDLQQQILERQRINRREHRPFNLNDYTNERCESNFRFDKTQLCTIIHAMELPSHFVFRAEDPDHRFQVSTEEVMAICLRRLAYPARLEDLGHMFGRTAPALSVIFNGMIEYLFNKYKSTLNFAESQFTRDRLQLFADAVAQKGIMLNYRSPISNVVGFIDGTVRGICRPVVNQEVVYNGHKYIIITNKNVSLLCIDDRTSRESLHNQKMSKVRVAVEWEFGRTVNLFAFLDYHKNQKVWLSPVGAYYFVGVLFKNIKICLGGGQACKYFGIEPPTIYEYLEHGNRVFREQQ
ncbi:hypothetical protein INT45_002588 [Circinella minor]|uniref:DDE Tnp4 domain-containing protein n=1 Tax=Circinella minor TaxID=1195481 RepID=A0A8H7VNW8_9FUNG|nr:hypothetical protein INT45_002588 [Circinella minor]